MSLETTATLPQSLFGSFDTLRINQAISLRGRKPSKVFAILFYTSCVFKKLIPKKYDC